MRIVGLTGGIATGKSAVTAQLRAAGIPLVDFDLIAREVCRKGCWGHKRVLKAFGDDILGPKGEIDRDKLGRLIFADKAARAKLNGATHPVIFCEAICQLLSLWLTCHWLVVVDMPLLIEVGAYHFLRPCVVVTCSREAEVERLMNRDGIDAKRAAEKIAAQMPLKEKEQMADIVIDNSGSREQTKQQVQRLIIKLRKGSSLWGIIFSPLLFVAAIGSFVAAGFWR
ncbi:hypothetical protein WJX74_009262 [Apatococcus lobatus]|uniref:Dephospho-CoA kinase n=1 Tax=Apatococcus lobatus TaxID=904363 RepID=A0AAW1S0E2_9CHLO